jgi:hypothetical protein
MSTKTKRRKRTEADTHNAKVRRNRRKSSKRSAKALTKRLRKGAGLNGFTPYQLRGLVLSSNRKTRKQIDRLLKVARKDD